MVVAVDDAGLGRTRHHPSRRAVEALLELLFGTAAHRIAGDHATEHAVHGGQIGPGTIG